jgi:hypothetical protein
MQLILKKSVPHSLYYMVQIFYEIKYLKKSVTLTVAHNLPIKSLVAFYLTYTDFDVVEHV